MKELKSFLSRVNYKISTQKLLDHFNEIDVKSRGELRFDDFSRLYQRLLMQGTVSWCSDVTAFFIYSSWTSSQLFLGTTYLNDPWYVTLRQHLRISVMAALKKSAFNCLVKWWKWRFSCPFHVLWVKNWP